MNGYTFTVKRKTEVKTTLGLIDDLSTNDVFINVINQWFIFDRLIKGSKFTLGSRYRVPLMGQL